MSTARATLLVALLAIGAPATAQDSGNGFLFREPSWSLSVRGGFAMPTAGSDLFSFATSQLTLNRGDFRSLDVGAALAYRVSERFDVIVDAEFSGMRKASEFRKWMDNNGRPIEQTTSFKRNPVTANVRYFLQPRGRTIGHFAWVPAAYATYVGAGVGMMSYEFDQAGDFVDAATKNVFPDHFNSSGWTPMAQAFAGVEWSLGPRWAVTTEARYVSASAALSSDFSGYQRIDLSGFSPSVSLHVRF